MAQTPEFSLMPKNHNCNEISDLIKSMKIEVKITDTDFLSDEKLPWATPISSEVSEVKGKDIFYFDR